MATLSFHYCQRWTTFSFHLLSIFLYVKWICYRQHIINDFFFIPSKFQKPICPVSRASYPLCGKWGVEGDTCLLPLYHEREDSQPTRGRDQNWRSASTGWEGPVPVTPHSEQFFQGPDYGTAGNWNGKGQFKPQTLHHVGSQRTRPSKVTACGTPSCGQRSTLRCLLVALWGSVLWTQRLLLHLKNYALGYVRRSNLRTVDRNIPENWSELHPISSFTRLVGSAVKPYPSSVLSN